MTKVQRLICLGVITAFVIAGIIIIIKSRSQGMRLHCDKVAFFMVDDEPIYLREAQKSQFFNILDGEHKPFERLKIRGGAQIGRFRCGDSIYSLCELGLVGPVESRKQFIWQQAGIRRMISTFRKYGDERSSVVGSEMLKALENYASDQPHL